MVILTIIPIAILVALPSIRLSVPQPGQYNIEQLWKATIVNPDNQTYIVWLEGKVEEASHGEVFWAQSDSFALPPGTKIVKYRDIRVLQHRSASGYERIFEQTGALPEGNYTFTIWLKPFNITDVINFQVQLPGAPRLVSPKDGSTITVPQPIFTWTPPAPAPTGRLSYEIKIVEIISGQTPLQAIQANPSWFQQQNIQVPNITYPLKAKPLDKNKTYAWQVVALADGQSIGRSEVWMFRYGPTPGGEGKCKCIIDSVKMDGNRLVDLDNELRLGHSSQQHTFTFFGHCEGENCRGIANYSHGVYLDCVPKGSGSKRGDGSQFGSYSFNAQFSNSVPVGSRYLVSLRLDCLDGSFCTRRFYVSIQ